jgi:hypothetical protein
LRWLCPAIPHSALGIPHSPQGVRHKYPESNSPSAPAPAWSGGTLDKPWTCPGTIDPLPDPIFDQARLSKSAPCGSAAGQRCRALDVGGSMFEVPYREPPRRRRVSRPISGTVPSWHTGCANLAHIRLGGRSASNAKPAGMARPGRAWRRSREPENYLRRGYGECPARVPGDSHQPPDSPPLAG